jgi:hypothetical protein
MGAAADQVLVGQQRLDRLLVQRDPSTHLEHGKTGWMPLG